MPDFKVLFVTLLLLAGPSKGSPMDQNSIKARIDKADRSLMKELDPNKAGDYSFLTTYQSGSTKSRELVLEISDRLQTDWSRELLFKGLKDKDAALQYRSSEMLLEHGKPSDAKRLYSELELRYPSTANDETNVNLLLALGNTGDSGMVEPLLTLRKKEKALETLEAYDKALAKLGFIKETRKLTFALEHGSPADKAKALTTLRYIHKPDWIPKVIPLLTNKLVARHTSMGPATFSIRVCDEAIATLGIIDPEKKIPFEVSDIFGNPFSSEELHQAQTAYGLIK